MVMRIPRTGQDWTMAWVLVVHFEVTVLLLLLPRSMEELESAVEAVEVVEAVQVRVCGI